MMQSAGQVSSSARFPSSHVSGGSTTPLPQTLTGIVVVEVMVVVGVSDVVVVVAGLAHAAIPGSRAITMGGLISALGYTTGGTDASRWKARFSWASMSPEISREPP
ncbi:MAG: hypothetical protein AAF517_14610, partial [Planctomycetota bacterium]